MVIIRMYKNCMGQTGSNLLVLIMMITFLMEKLSDCVKISLEEPHLIIMVFRMFQYMYIVCANPINDECTPIGLHVLDELNVFLESNEALLSVG